jgi:hypothetical protein
LNLARELIAIAGDNPHPVAISALTDTLLTGHYTGDDQPPLQDLGSTTLWRFTPSARSPLTRSTRS